MGGGLALLCAEKGLTVSLEDPSDEAMDNVIKHGKDQGFGERLSKYNDYKKLCESLDSPKVFLFSLPHGNVGDSVLDGLMPYLVKGDIILDAGNEHWSNTERRQGKCTTRGIRYVGVGVSGGYQAARAGPSMCPGADDASLDMVMPFFEKIAAKDKDGKPCVAKAGLGGAGHYVKMLHNGIEHGMMSAIAEAWQIMEIGLGMSDNEIGDVLEKWNADGPLRGTFLVDIGAAICRTKDKKGKNVLDSVEDKVVQDLTGEEGTGVWSNEESVAHHIPAPTLNIAHDFRLASAYRGQRERAQKTMGGEFRPQKLDISGEEKKTFVEDLREATYLACLASYIQGINVIQQANEDNGWCIDYAAVWQIWRGGCIIQADYIAELIEPSLKNYKDKDSMNLMFESAVAKDIKSGMPSLRRVVAKGVEKDHVMPALSASLEYIKYQVNTELPTQFYEAELDFFGNHMFDIKGEKGTDGPTEGKHHFEWRPAKGSNTTGYTS